MKYILLFLTFAKIGMFTIGGGYAMIPLIEREIVKKKWMSKEDFMEMLLERIIEVMEQDKYFTAVSFLEDKAVFGELGFSEEKVWTRYVRMKKDKWLWVYLKMYMN